MTITKISETIRERLGWCPATPAIRTAPAATIPSPVIVHPPGTDGSSAGSGRIDRGIRLVIGSIKILFRNKRLFGFSLLIGLVILFSLATSLAISYFSGKDPFPGTNLFTVPGPVLFATGSIPFVLLTFAAELVGAFCWVFLLAGLIVCVSACLSGEVVTIGGGLKIAGNHARSLFSWAIIIALAGTLMVLVQEQYSEDLPITMISMGVFALFSVLTLFVVPVLVFERKGIIDSVSESVSLFIKTWGELIVSAVIFGLIFIAVAMTALVPMIAVAISSATEEQMLAGATLVVTAYMTVLVVLVIVASALAGILITGLYTYAKTGRLPGLFLKKKEGELPA